MLVASSTFISAQSGTLDPSFNGTGLTLGNYTSGNNSADAMVIQPDGKIVVSGATGISSSINTGVSRYNTDGTIDTTFGTNGKVSFSSGTGTKSYIYDMALQTDGKIVMAGYRWDGSQGDFLMARVNANGTLDNTFGVNGVAVFDDANSEVAESFAINADGSFIVSGYVNDNYTLLKVKNNGTIDTAFGTNGWVTTPFKGLSASSKSTSINAAGRIIVGGMGVGSGQSEFVMAAYNPDGTLDNTFGQAGRINFHIGYDNDFGLKVLQLENGKIVFGGHSYVGSTPLRYELAVVRLNANGSFDNSFGENGIFKSRFFIDGRSYLSDMVVQADGKLLVTGPANVNNEENYGLLRITENGQLDTTFGVDRQVIQKIDNTYAISKNIALQTDGKIVVSGDATPFGGGKTQFFIARYINPVLAVQNVKDATVALYPNPASDQITLDWNGSNKTYEVEIYNMVCQKVMTAKVSNKSAINISSLVKGNYVVKIKDAGNTKTIQFIKK